jgi:hypothetical protein
VCRSSTTHPGVTRPHENHAPRPNERRAGEDDKHDLEGSTEKLYALKWLLAASYRLREDSW